jgi:hypothetical protein
VTEDLLEAGRDAITRHAWKDAFDLLSAAEQMQTDHAQER